MLLIGTTVLAIPGKDGETRVCVERSYSYPYWSWHSVALCFIHSC